MSDSGINALAHFIAARKIREIGDQLAAERIQKQQLAAQLEIARANLQTIANFHIAAPALFAEKALEKISKPDECLAELEKRIAEKCAKITKAVLDLHEDSPLYAELCSELGIPAPHQQPALPGQKS